MSTFQLTFIIVESNFAWGGLVVHTLESVAYSNFYLIVFRGTGRHSYAYCQFILQSSQRYEKLICKIENKLACQFIVWGIHIF